MIDDIKDILEDALEDFYFDVVYIVNNIRYLLTDLSSPGTLATCLVIVTILLYYLARPGHPVPSHQTRIDGKTGVVVWSGTEDWGMVALDLVRRGARVVIACSNYTTGEMTAQRIRDLVDTRTVIPMVQVETVNLAEMEDVRRFAYKILETETPVDILVCNGDLTMERMYRTEAGLEVMMATNHLSFFLLVNILLPSIARSKVTTVHDNQY